MKHRPRDPGRGSWYPQAGALLLAACATLTACHSTIPAGGRVQAPGPMTGQAVTTQTRQVAAAITVVGGLGTQSLATMITLGPVSAQDLGRAGGSTLSEEET